MNENDIAYLIAGGVCTFGLLAVVILQQIEMRLLRKTLHQFIIQWQSWAAAKIEDYPTARLLAGIARQNPSAGANNVSVEVPKKPKQGFTLKQSAE